MWHYNNSANFEVGYLLIVHREENDVIMMDVSSNASVCMGLYNVAIFMNHYFRCPKKHGTYQKLENHLENVLKSAK